MKPNPDHLCKLLVGKTITMINSSWRPGDQPELTINAIVLDDGTKIFFAGKTDRQVEICKSSQGPETNVWIRPNDWRD